MVYECGIHVVRKEGGRAITWRRTRRSGGQQNLLSQHRVRDSWQEHRLSWDTYTQVRCVIIPSRYTWNTRHTGRVTSPKKRSRPEISYHFLCVNTSSLYNCLYTFLSTYIFMWHTPIRTWETIELRLPCSQKRNSWTVCTFRWSKSVSRMTQRCSCSSCKLGDIWKGVHVPWQKPDKYTDKNDFLDSPQKSLDSQQKSWT